MADNLKYADKLMLVDGNSILNRAFYGLQGPRLLSTSYGLYTNAVYGFINVLLKYIEEENPQYLCIAFDLKAPTFRHLEYDGYKAKRKGMPDELAVQVPIIKEVLDAMNISRFELEGFEADDIIGSLSLCAEKMNMDVIIVTGDRDSLQLASDTTRIKIPVTKGGKTETEEYNRDAIIEKYGITPLQVIDLKGLMGDSSDNIPGVPGIGEKTALDLMRKFGSLENIYDNVGMVEKAGVREKLTGGRELAFLSRKLALINREMPELCSIDALKRRDADQAKLFEVFDRLEFRSLIDKLRLKEAGNNSKTSFECAIQLINQVSELDRLKSTLKDAGKFSVFHLLDKAGDFNTALSGIGLSAGGGNTYYISVREDTNSSGNGFIPESCFLDKFKELFEDESILKIGHNIKPFIVYLKNRGIELKGISFDTMIGAYLLDSSRETYTIAELAALYLKSSVEPVELLAGKGKSSMLYRDIPFEKIGNTAGTHAEVIYNAAGIIDKLIGENNQKELYYNIELPLTGVLADMEFRGFMVDCEGLRRLSGELEYRIDILVKNIHFLAGEEFNINSTKQLGVVLYEKLGLPVLKKTKTGYSTDADVLDQLYSRHEIIPNLLDYRQLVKLKSTYVEGLLAVVNPATGRIHTSFNQTVTVTGRISSTEPNLQNIPVKLDMGRNIRKVFIPGSSDHVLTDADYSQIELRVLAHITGDENMISAFRNNEDIHTSTAVRIFGVSADKVTPVMRSRAKTINFGIVYGMGDFSLSKDLGITKKKAKEYIDEYFSKYPGVRKYMHDIVEEGRKDGFVTTLYNRRRYLPELKSPNFNIRSFGERIAMNTPIQGSAADIIKVAMVKVYNELLGRNLKSRLILQVHDELIIETLNSEKDEVTALLKDCMENSVALSVPLSVEVKTGTSWYDTK